VSLVKGKMATTLEKGEEEDEGKKLLIHITLPLITAKRTALL
jgi:hypothetical protein